MLISGFEIKNKLLFDIMFDTDAELVLTNKADAHSFDERSRRRNGIVLISRDEVWRKSTPLPHKPSWMGPHNYDPTEEFNLRWPEQKRQISFKRDHGEWRVVGTKCITDAKNVWYRPTSLIDKYISEYKFTLDGDRERFAHDMSLIKMFWI